MRTSNTKRLLAAALTLVCVFAYVVFEPTSMLAEGIRAENELSENIDAINSIWGSKPDPYSPLVGELADERDEDVKRLCRADGSDEMVAYADPVHYLVDGEWAAIDNTLKYDEETGRFVNTANDLVVELSSGISKDSPLYTISYNGETLTMINADIPGITDRDGVVSGIPAERERKSDLTDEECDRLLRFPEELSSALSYYMEDGSEAGLEYKLSCKTLSEYITLFEKPEEAPVYTYTFTTTLKPRQEENVVLFENETGEVVLYFSAPVMRDAKDNECESFEVELIFNEDGSYTYTLTPDEDWLMSGETVYPVVIDPDVNVNFRSNVQDTYISSSDVNGKYYSYDRIKLGASSTYRSLIQVTTLPALKPGDVVIEASLNLTRYASNVNNSNGKEIDVYKIIKSWSESTTSWSSFNPNSSSSVDTSRIQNIAFSAYPGYINSIDITTLVKEWYLDPSSNHGVLLRLKTEGGSNPPYVEYTSSNYNPNYELHPYFSIIYINSTGLEGRFNYSGHGVGRAGTGNINLFSGNLTFSFADGEINNGTMPISVSHVYNTNDMGTDIGYGYGWRLNYAQEINEVQITDGDGTQTFYEYVDGDGTRHYYKKETATKYVNELDHDSVLTISADNSISGNITITDKGDNKLVFRYGTVSGKKLGRLIRVEDANGNQTLITYTTTNVIGSNNKQNLHISSITEKLAANSSNGQSITMTYDGNGRLSAVSVPNGLGMSYGYSSGKLISVTYADGNTSTFTYTGNKIESVESIDGYTVEYEYDGRSRVVSVSEHIGNDDGNSLSYEYGWNVTTVTYDPGSDQERHTVYQFNNAGQAVSVRDNAGNAVYAAYNSDPQTTTQLSAVSKMQNTVVNLLKDHGFDNGTTEWTLSGASTSSTCFYTGRYSLKLTASQYADQTVSVTAGKTYTLSARFAGASGGVLKVFNGNTQLAVSDTVQTLDNTTDWQRGAVTFTVPAGVETVTVHIEKPSGSSGTTYVDAVQFEEGEAPNRYNMLKNSDFSDGMSSWTNNGTTSSDGIVTDTSDSHPDSLSDYVYHIVGSSQNEKCIEQSISVNGKKGDTYSFGAWVRSDSIPYHMEGFDGLYYGIKRMSIQFKKNNSQVNFCPVYFSADTNEWQFACGSAVAKGDYDQIVISLNFHRTVNDCYYDGAQLYREEFSQAYEYDANGNLKNYTSLISQENDFQYDSNNNLTSAKDARGNTTAYTYDSNHNLLTTTTPEGVITTNVYDTNGNVTSTQVGNSTDYIKAATTYDSATALATAVTDARGNSVIYGYDSTTRLQTTITDPKTNNDNANNNTNNVTTTYTYGDAASMLRLASLTSSGTGTVEYGYDAYGKLTDITRDDTVYIFTYDSWGRVVDTKVGNIVLSTNQYDEYGRLERVSYGNGFVTEYVYDELDRVSEIKQGTAGSLVLTYKYIYNGEGDLYELRNYKTLRSTFFEYDHAGRCMASTEKSFTVSGSMVTYTGTISGYKYEYDANNNLSKLTCRLGDGNQQTSWVTTYSYDKDNRPTTALLDNGRSVVNTYDAIGRITSRKIKNGNSDILETVITYVAGTNGSKTALVSTYQNGSDGSYSYTYDANGNITAITKGSMSFTYTYDAANQLVRENLYYGSGNSNNATYGYTYDEWGNLLLRKKYTYSTLENLSNHDLLETVTYGYTNTQWGDLLTSYNGNTITYDAMGNPTSYLGSTLAWEGKRLVSALVPVPGVNRPMEIGYAYNENGLRMSKTVNSTTTEYFYNGSVLIGMKIGTGSSAKVLRFSYDASGNVAAVDYSANNGSTFATYYYVRNAQNDIVKLIDNSGTAVVEYIYDSWGKVLSTTGTYAGTVGLDQPFRYRGYVYDAETGWYYLQSRYYDPATCRFISADVLLSTGQGVIGHNSFACCLNNPVNCCDTSGCACVINEQERMLIEDRASGSLTVFFNQDTAKRLINEIFANEGYTEVMINFTSAGAHIVNSFMVELEEIRLRICRILEHTEGFLRTAESLSAEWKLHNDLYYSLFALVPRVKSSAKDADLDYINDGRWYINDATSLYDYFGIH